MRQLRLILLTAFLVAALATQRIMSLQPGLADGLLELPKVAAVARRLARKLTRQTQVPARRDLFDRLRVSLRRLTLRVLTPVRALIELPTLSPFEFRLPPPALA